MPGWYAFGIQLGRTLSPSKPTSGLKYALWVVCRWHAAWQERCQALERLRVCISRKRISFRLFKQWYWESFDDDVQVRMLALAGLMHRLMLCSKTQHLCMLHLVASLLLKTSVLMSTHQMFGNSVSIRRVTGTLRPVLA